MQLLLRKLVNQNWFEEFQTTVWSPSLLQTDLFGFAALSNHYLIHY